MSNAPGGRLYQRHPFPSYSGSLLLSNSMNNVEETEMSTVYILKAKVNGQEAIIGVSDVGAGIPQRRGIRHDKRGEMDQLPQGWLCDSLGRVAVPGLLVLGEPPAREAGGAGYDFRQRHYIVAADCEFAGKIEKVVFPGS